MLIKQSGKSVIQPCGSCLGLIYGSEATAPCYKVRND